MTTSAYSTAATFVLDELRLLPTAAKAPHGPLASMTARFTLLAVAELADEALNSPNGYNGHTATQIARVIGLSPGVTGKWLQTLETTGLVTRTKPATPATYRITEKAFA